MPSWPPVAMSLPSGEKGDALDIGGVSIEGVEILPTCNLPQADRHLF